MDSKRLDSILSALALVVLAGWLAARFIAPDDWIIRYAAQYMVSPSDVTIEPRPTRCDWWHAPLGDKACHYRKVVQVVKWRMASSGKPEISYDDGKVWVEGEPDKDQAIPATHVSVGWVRVEDP